MLHSLSGFDRFMVTFRSVIKRAHCNKCLNVSTTMNIERVTQLPLAENPTLEHFEVDYYLTDNTEMVHPNT